MLKLNYLREHQQTFSRSHFFFFSKRNIFCIKLIQITTCNIFSISITKTSGLFFVKISFTPIKTLTRTESLNILRDLFRINSFYNTRVLTQNMKSKFQLVLIWSLRRPPPLLEKSNKFQNWRKTTKSYIFLNWTILYPFRL